MTELADMAEEAWLSFQDDRPTVIGVDTETEGVAFHDPAFCVTIAWKYVDPDGSGDEHYESHYIEIGDEDYAHVARMMLMETPTWVFHHAKFDLHKLLLAGIIERHEITPDRFEDTEALAHLGDEHRRKGLKFLARELLGDDTDEEAELKAAMRKNKLKLEEGYHLLPREVLIPYAKKDPVLTLQLYEILEPPVALHDDLWGLYQHEKRVSLTLLDMERRGLGVDNEYVTEQLGEFSSQVLSLEARISEIVGKPIGKDVKAGEFNPSSNPQLADYFRDKGFEADSYDKHFLAACEDPLAKVLTDYRKAVKFKNTYFLAIRNEARDGILHPHFRQHGTVTGRMSSGGVSDQ